MASRSLSDMKDDMIKRTISFINLCRENGIDPVIYCTLRDLREQAILFRQGRTYAQIEDKMNKLHNSGFGFLADIIESVGPQKGDKIVTNAAPGESWHNYGEAFDGIPVINGKLDWNISEKYWKIYGDCAVKCGLVWAGNWETFKEYPHVQLRQGGNPLKIYSPDHIKKMLKKWL